MSRLATQQDINFYKHFKIKAPFIISDCSYYNIHEFGIDEGNDVCPAVEDETFHCKDCEYSKCEHEWYPEIDATLLLHLVLLIGISARDLKEIFDFKTIIFEQCKNSNKKDSIIELLHGYIGEHLRS